MAGASADGKLVELSIDDLVLINNALNEILNGPGAIEPRQFQTRTGAAVAQAENLLSRINSVIESDDGH